MMLKLALLFAAVLLLPAVIFVVIQEAVDDTRRVHKMQDQSCC
jgi:hypothetical protein